MWLFSPTSHSMQKGIDLEDFADSYMGDNSQVINLYSELPLHEVAKTFEIDGHTKTITVDFKEEPANVSDRQLQADFVISSIAYFACFTNLEQINYQLPSRQVKFDRATSEAILGDDLSRLVNQETWAKEVQEKISSQKFIQLFYK